MVIDRFLLIFERYQRRQIPAFCSHMLNPAASVASMLEAAINQWLQHPTENMLYNPLIELAKCQGLV